MSWLGILAAATEQTDNLITDPITWLVASGPIGVILVLIMLGWLEPKRAVDRLEIERDRLQRALEKEQEAHDQTRQALRDAQSSAETANANAAVTVGLLRDLGHPTTRGSSP